VEHNKIENMVRLTVKLCRGESISKLQIMRDYGVSIATAKRYLVEISCLLPVITQVENRNRVYFIPRFLRQLENPPFGKRAA
jgi:hypothetical protein